MDFTNFLVQSFQKNMAVIRWQENVSRSELDTFYRKAVRTFVIRERICCKSKASFEGIDVLWLQYLATKT